MANEELFFDPYEGDYKDIELQSTGDSQFKLFYEKHFFNFNLPHEPDSLALQVFLMYDDFINIFEFESIDFGEFLTDLQQIYYRLAISCELEIDESEDAAREQYFKNITTKMDECVMMVETELFRFNAYNSKKSTVARENKKTFKERTVNFGTAERIWLLKEMGFFELDFFKGLDSPQINDIVTTILDKDNRTIVGLINSLNPSSDESKNVIGIKHKDNVRKFIRQYK